jgi:hypothetical protein
MRIKTNFRFSDNDSTTIGAGGPTAAGQPQANTQAHEGWYFLKAGND